MVVTKDKKISEVKSTTTNFNFTILFVYMLPAETVYATNMWQGHGLG